MKKIFITGCSRGLGLAMTRGFMEKGHEVFGVARNRESIDALGDESRFRVCDVSDDSAVREMASEFLETKGVPDLLINNAALINRNAPLWAVPEEEFTRILMVNIGGIANMIRHFVPPMIEKRTGVIVNFSSYWGRSASSEVGPYCATKWAVEGMTSAMAQELPSGLAAVALNPGVINTEMLQSCFGSGAEASVSPGDWAKSAVPFIESFDASHNGQSLTVPGQ